MTGSGLGQSRCQNNPPHHKTSFVPFIVKSTSAQPARLLFSDTKKEGVDAALAEYRDFKGAGLLHVWRARWKHILKPD